MGEFRSFRSRGQTAVLVALVGLAVIAFIALAVDGGNAYGLRRQAQNAADGAAIAGTWQMVNCREVGCGSPVAAILRKVNQYAEANGVHDTDGVPGDVDNDNVLAYYIDYDGNCIPLGEVCWELHDGPDQIPANAKGIEAHTAMSQTTFFARAIGVQTVRAAALAAATFQPDGGILPIAVNEYWAGSQGKCPYYNCGEPYSFVRDPEQPPPFTSEDGGDPWVRQYCPNELNENTCQGAYEDFDENFGRVFAILGQDAVPNYGSMDPRSFVHLDWRYDSLVDGQDGWYYLVEDEIFMGPDKPMGNKQEMSDIIQQGGYNKWPIPRALHEPPPQYIEEAGAFAHCWDSPPGPETCFNNPEIDRDEPYDIVEFLSGADAAKEAKAMWDDGNFVGGRYEPGQHLVIMVYNGAAADQWGFLDHKDDAALIVGYFGAVIVGYGNNFDKDACRDCDIFDLDCFIPCIEGQPNTVFGMVGDDGMLVIDPSDLLEEFLPKELNLIK